jgi:hypothetical protein
VGLGFYLWFFSDWDIRNLIRDEVYMKLDSKYEGPNIYEITFDLFYKVNPIVLGGCIKE